MTHTWYSLFTELQHHSLLGSPIRANSDRTSNKAHPADLVSFSLIGLYENAYKSSRFSEIKKEMRSPIVFIIFIINKHFRVNQNLNLITSRKTLKQSGFWITETTLLLTKTKSKLSYWPKWLELITVFTAWNNWAESYSTPGLYSAGTIFPLPIHALRWRKTTWSDISCLREQNDNRIKIWPKHYSAALPHHYHWKIIIRFFLSKLESTS